MNHQLNRFVNAHEYSYAQALSEIQSGYKYSHWMWYIFPQIKGLGFSSTSQVYAIQSKAEAEAYLNHELLGAHLIEISKELLKHKDKSASEIFGGIDALKLHSCMTLFHLTAPDHPVFKAVLNHYFQGNLDQNTIHILQNMEESK